MSTTLHISNKILSLKGQMNITDELDSPLFTAQGEWAFFRTKWGLFQGERQIARIEKKLFSWSSTWLITSDIGNFTLKRKTWSWTRKYYVIDGPFDGAEIKGNLWDLKFEISHQGHQIAAIADKVFSIRDKAQITVHDDRPEGIIFTCIAMVATRLDKSAESSASSDG